MTKKCLTVCTAILALSLLTLLGSRVDAETVNDCIAFSDIIDRIVSIRDARGTFQTALEYVRDTLKSNPHQDDAYRVIAFAFANPRMPMPKAQIQARYFQQCLDRIAYKAGWDAASRERLPGP